MAHLLAGRRGHARDVAHDRLRHVRLDEVGRFLFGRAADLAEHDDGLGVGVGFEQLEAVDEARAGNRVAADADARGDADALLVQLVERLVGERAGAADDADRSAGLRDLGRDEADVALARRQQARAVRSEDARCSGSRASTGCRSAPRRASGCLRSRRRSARARLRRPRAPRPRPPGAGTITIVAVAPVSVTASSTDANTGMPSTSVPAFFGLTPPTTCVPYVAVAQAVEAALPAGEALHDHLRVGVDENAHCRSLRPAPRPCGRRRPSSAC